MARTSNAVLIGQASIFRRPTPARPGFPGAAVILANAREQPSRCKTTRAFIVKSACLRF